MNKTNIQDRQLLFQDLCSRLPYGVKVQLMNAPAFGECECIFPPSALSFYKVDMMGVWAEGANVSRLYKPYLFPLHTITNEQKEELRKILNFDEAWFEEVWGEDRFFDWSVGGSVSSETFTMNVTDIIRTIDFFHRYNFDCRGLIPKGLAIDATGLNIYNS